jgi:hypothetical protein
MFENRRWLVIPTSITGSIDFNQVLESSTGSLRLSVDGTQTFVKYEITEITASYTEEYEDLETGEIRSSTIQAGTYGRPAIYSDQYTEYTHSEILNLLESSDWTLPIDLEDVE